MSESKLPKLDETAVEEIPSGDLEDVAGGIGGTGCGGVLTCQNTCMARTETQTKSPYDE